MIILAGICGKRKSVQNETSNQWSEGDSANFLDLVEIFILCIEQMSTLLQLILARTDEQFTFAELASGEGTQTHLPT